MADATGARHVRRSLRLQHLMEAAQMSEASEPGLVRGGGQLRDLNSLPDELLEKILSAVVKTAGAKFGLTCMEVCKRWKRVAALGITELKTPKRLRLLPSVPMSKFENLRTLHLNRARVPSWRWRHVFRALAQGCPRLNAVSLQNVKPMLCEKEVRSLLRTCPSVRTLELHKCFVVSDDKAFPSSHHVRKLESLTISHNRSLKHLPPLESFTALHTLTLRAVPRLRLFPLTFIPPTLRSLHLSGLHVASLPSLQLLSHLTSLVLQSFPALTELPPLHPLTSLRHLSVSSCWRLPELPPFTGLHLLETLRLACNPLLVATPPVDALPSLSTLDLYNCRELKQIPGIRNAPRLKQLDLELCDNLELPRLGLAHMPRLQGLIIPLDTGRFSRFVQGLVSLTSLELKLRGAGGGSLRQLPELRRLIITAELDSPVAQTLPSLRALPGLTSLDLRDINFPLKHGMFNKLTALQSLGFSRMRNWTLPNLNPLVVLRELRFEECNELQQLPRNIDLPALTSFVVERSTGLMSVYGLNSLTALQQLSITDTYNLYALPDISNLVNLRELRLESTQIRHLPSLNALSQLTSLWFENLKVQILPDLGQLGALRELTVHNCRMVLELPGVMQLTNLHTLCVNGHHDHFYSAELKAWAQSRTPKFHRFHVSWHHGSVASFDWGNTSGSDGMSDAYDSSEPEIGSRENYRQPWGKVYSSSSEEEED